MRLPGHPIPNGRTSPDLSDQWHSGPMAQQLGSVPHLSQGDGSGPLPDRPASVAARSGWYLLPPLQSEWEWAEEGFDKNQPAFGGSHHGKVSPWKTQTPLPTGMLLAPSSKSLVNNSKPVPALHMPRCSEARRPPEVVS